MSDRGMAHGGDVGRISRESGIPRDRILDFSANVNPRGLPAPAMARLTHDAQDARVLTEYPDPEATELRHVLAQRLAIPMECVVVGAGADSLIHAAVRALAPRRCIIPIPAFSEYERACRAFGCETHLVQLALERRCKLDLPSLSVSDLVILTNPHNPTGTCAGIAEMRERIQAIRAAGAAVLVDEAFIDYVPGSAITADATMTDGIVAVRSLTKFFGCAGLRVGYAVAAPDLAARLKAQLPAWPVTTMALNALVEALSDEAYAHATLESNSRARAILVEALESLGCRVFPPSANFIFFQLPQELHAAMIRRRLLMGHAILVRDCDTFAGLAPGRYLRIAVRQESENSRLIQALASVFRETSCQQHS